LLYHATKLNNSLFIYFKSVYFTCGKYVVLILRCSCQLVGIG